SWVLVLGRPVWVEEGLVGAAAVADRLASVLATAPLRDVKAAAAVLAGSWVVAISTPGRSVVLTDPLVSLGAHLTPDGRGVVAPADRGGAPRREDAAPGLLGSDEAAVTTGPLGGAPLARVPLSGSVDLADLAGAAAASGVTRADRLRGHVRLMRDRGPVWLG